MGTERIFDQRGVRIIYALLITGISIFILNPYAFGVHDHWYMLPWIKNLANPELFALDPVTAQRDYHYSILFKLIHFSPLSVEVSFFLVYTLCIGVAIYMAMAIHRLFSKNLVYLTPLFLLIPWFTPGGTFTIASHLLMRTSGLPLLLIVLYFWLKNKPWLAWLVLGVSFLFHPTTALYMAAFMGIHLLADTSRRMDRQQWLAILGFVVLTIPVFIAKFTAPDIGFPGVWADDYWLETIRIRSAHHAFPDAWYKWHVVSGAGLFLAMLAGVAFTRNAQLKRYGFAVLLGTALIYTAGLLFTYVWPAFLAIQVQPFKVSRLVMLLSLLFIPILLSDKKLMKGYIPVSVFMGGVLLCAAFIQSHLHFYLYLSLLLPVLFSWIFPSLQRFALVFLISGTLILLAHKPFRELELKATPQQKEDRLYSWIKANTSPHSLWIIPGDMMYFRNFTDRNVLVAWWDGTFGYFDYNYNRDWRMRYEEVFGELNIERTEPQISSIKTLDSLTATFSTEGIFVLKREPMISDDFLEVWSHGEFYIYVPKP